MTLELDRYEVLRPLGRGNVGTVYIARHRMTGREVALKVSDPRGDPELVARALNEARIAASAQHPSLVDIFDCGTLEDGRVFVAMQHVEGDTLEAVLEAEGGKLAPERAVSFALQVLSALEALHARGIVHRDIKPSNLLIQRRADGHEHVYLIDFGISKVLPPSTPAVQSPTVSGTILGTPGYMPPEELDARTVDARADLFAVGAVLFRAISGRTLFDADSLGDWFIALAQQAIPSLASVAPWVSPALTAVIDRAISLDREARPPSASAMHAWLIAAMTATETVPALQQIDPPPARPPRVRWGVGAAASLALLGFGALVALAARSLDGSSVRVAMAAPVTPVVTPDAATQEPNELQSAFAALAMRAFNDAPGGRATNQQPSSAAARTTTSQSLIESSSGAVSLQSARPSAGVDMGALLALIHGALPEIERCHAAPGGATTAFSLTLYRHGSLRLADPPRRARPGAVRLSRAAERPSSAARGAPSCWRGARSSVRLAIARAERSRGAGSRKTPIDALQRVITVAVGLRTTGGLLVEMRLSVPQQRSAWSEPTEQA